MEMNNYWTFDGVDRHQAGNRSTGKYALDIGSLPQLLERDRAAAHHKVRHV